MFTVEELREIIELVEKSSLQSFELKQGSEKLRMAKAANVMSVGDSRPFVDAINNKVEIKSLEKNEAIEENLKFVNVIASPMVGTFYAAAEPGGEPLVKVGQKVAAGSVVCIVEVMKLFNEVEAETAGVITEALVKDGEFVEYGQPLFRLCAEKG
jgi:acetyl-CoA carboxylase biotin carboxyl carrier protein